MITEDIATAFGVDNMGSAAGDAVAQPGQPGASVEPSLDLLDTSDESMDARIARLEAWGKEQTGTQQGSDQQKPNAASQQAAAQQATADAGKSAAGGAPGQQQATQPAPDPVKAFDEASQKAFLSDSGELDTAKINDFYLTNGKSILKYAVNAPAPVGSAPDFTDKVATIDPEKEYSEKVADVAANFGAILEDQAKRGFTGDQALANIRQYLADLTRDRDARLEMKKTIAEEAKRFAPDFEEARQARITAAIDRNTAELSSGLNGLIPGLDGRQVLNQFILNKKYGGEYVNHLFAKAHPEAAKLPEAQRVTVAEKWFDEFQQNRAEMAYVAEFGRLRWMAENMKPILEHAQRVGAAKVQNGREALGIAPSGITTPRKASGISPTEQFLYGGADTVN